MVADARYEGMTYSSHKNKKPSERQLRLGRAGDDCGTAPGAVS
jgi:hypothetical protein